MASKKGKKNLKKYDGIIGRRADGEAVTRPFRGRTVAEAKQQYHTYLTEHGIDAEGIEVNDEYFLNWKVEQVNANMLNADEVEIKAVIALEAIVFKKVEQNFVTEINQEPVDMEALNSAPVLKGYIVQKGDTLWKLAKENYTTIEKIMTVNNLENETIKKGDRLLIIKSCQA